MAFPVDNRTHNLTGKFGPRPPFLVNGKWTNGFHAAVDLAPEVKGQQTACYAIRAGRVRSVGTKADAGRFAIVHFPSIAKWGRYCHLSSYGVQAGQDLADAQYVGRLGATGVATGVHLHFELYDDFGLTNRVNPLPFIWSEPNPVSYPINQSAPKPTPTPTPKPKPTPAPATKSAGGADVASLQTWLNATFPSYSRLARNGRYDAATQKVIAEFQRRVGTIGAADGNIGPRTKAALQHHGFKDWDGGKAPAPKPAPSKPAPAPSGRVLGRSLVLAQARSAYRTYQAAKSRKPVWYQVPRGTYKVTGYVQGQFHIVGNGHDVWVSDGAAAGLR